MQHEIMINDVDKIVAVFLKVIDNKMIYIKDESNNRLLLCMNNVLSEFREKEQYDLMFAIPYHYQTYWNGLGMEEDTEFEIIEVNTIDNSVRIKLLHKFYKQGQYIGMGYSELVVKSMSIFTSNGEEYSYELFMKNVG